MVQRIAGNFYLRNLAVLLIFLSPELFQSIAIHKKLDLQDVSARIFSISSFFLFFIFHNRVLYEKLFLKRNYLLYGISFLGSVFIWRESGNYLYWLSSKPPEEKVYHIRELEKYDWVLWVFVYWADVVYTYISLGVYLSFKYFKEYARLLQSENIQRELELKQLNEQLNPHFLFNALNNIYSYQVCGLGDGRELVLKLSELLRYILESSKKETVALGDEVAFIEHYMRFEKERLGERCDIDYKKEFFRDFKIVPLILFNFIENAFKHGTTSISKSKVIIRLEADRRHLRLFVSNPLPGRSLLSTKIGMNNTRRRLELLYPGAHTLDLDQQAGKYNVSLKLDAIQ